MIELTPTEDQINRAKERFEFGRLNNSITDGGGNIHGALGEILFIDHFNALDKSSYDYDVMIRDMKIEIKTQRINVKPQMHYNAKVSGNNIKQKCDYYYFIYILYDFSKAWLVGGLPREKFHELAKFAENGENVDGLPFRSDTYYVQLNQLWPNK